MSNEDEAATETTILLVNGSTVRVQHSPEEIRDKILKTKAKGIAALNGPTGEVYVTTDKIVSWSASELKPWSA